MWNRALRAYNPIPIVGGAETTLWAGRYKKLEGHWKHWCSGKNEALIGSWYLKPNSCHWGKKR